MTRRGGVNEVWRDRGDSKHMPESGPGTLHVGSPGVWVLDTGLSWGRCSTDRPRGPWGRGERPREEGGWSLLRAPECTSLAGRGRVQDRGQELGL